MGEVKGYEPVQIGLHWAMALMIASQFAFGATVLPAWHYLIVINEYYFSPALIAHLVVGTVVLILLPWRFRVRRSHTLPPPPEGFDPRLEALSHLVHRLTYAVLLLIPVSGLIAFWGDLRPVSTVHNVLAATLLGLVGMHAAGALYHQFIRHDGLLMRMLRSRAAD